MSSKLQSDIRFGGAIWWMLTEWRPGVVDWGGSVFASCCHGSNCSLARTLDGRCSTIDSCRSTATSYDCKARLVRFRPCKTRYIRIPGFSFSFSFRSALIAALHLSLSRANLLIPSYVSPPVGLSNIWILFLFLPTYLLIIIIIIITKTCKAPYSPMSIITHKKN